MYFIGLNLHFLKRVALPRQFRRNDEGEQPFWRERWLSLDNRERSAIGEELFSYLPEGREPFLLGGG